MQFANPRYENEELSYEDVFLFQQYFDGVSRMHDIDIKPQTPLPTSLPIVSANMNAVTGKRMAETLWRYGGLGVLPQDMSLETISKIVKFIKSANTRYETPLVVYPTSTIRDALWIIHKREHQSVVLVDEDNKVVNIFKEDDFQGLDQYTLLKDIQKASCITAPEDISNQEAYELMHKKRISVLPLVDKNNKLKWILSKQHCVRMEMYTPTLDKNGKLDLAVAIGINQFEARAKALYEMWIRIFVLDTAHWFQRRMKETIQKARSMFGKNIIIVAWNVVTSQWVEMILEAGADGVKVGVGPWAMCTTRLKTGVGRPQFTAVKETARTARQLWWFVWADGGIKNPRDMVLALAAGASHVMIGTLFAWTYESTGDIFYDEEGKMYKENYGMASKKAVVGRNNDKSAFEVAKKQIFREGISSSKIYLRQGMSSVGEVVDNFTTWLRSAMTYVWAKNLEELYQKALIWVQTQAWYYEGTPHWKIVK